MPLKFVFGPSGSGKSTMVDLIPRYYDVQQGAVLIDGINVKDTTLHDLRSIMGNVNQEAILFNDTFYNNITFGVENATMEQVIEAAKIANAHDFIMETEKGYDTMIGDRGGRLSGGQRQRVALGRAMVRNPAVFLLDEPLSNLDAKLRTSMRTEIIKLHKKLATTFIYVTHDQTEAMTMGDRIVVMRDGVIQQVDTPQNLYDYPCNIFVAGFIGSPQMNFLDGTLIKKGDLYGIDLGGDVIPLPKEKTADGKLDAYVGKKIKMGVRPEDIDDEPEFMAKHPDCHLEAQVDVSEMMGAEIYLYLEYKGNKMTARVAPTSKARNGDTVRVAFDPHKVHLFDIETEQTILN